MSRPLSPGYLILGAACLALLVKLFVLDLAVVEGASMEPSLRAGRVVPVFRAAYGLRLPPFLAGRSGYLLRWASPRVGEVVAARNPQDGQPVIKRVAAAGPLSLRVEERRLVGPGVDIELGDRVRGPREGLELGRDQFYLTGDNPPRSLDSRDYGPLPLELIAGRILGAPDLRGEGLPREGKANASATRTLGAGLAAAEALGAGAAAASGEIEPPAHGGRGS